LELLLDLADCFVSDMFFDMDWAVMFLGPGWVSSVLVGMGTVWLSMGTV